MQIENSQRIKYSCNVEILIDYEGLLTCNRPIKKYKNMLENAIGIDNLDTYEFKNSNELSK